MLTVSKLTFARMQLWPKIRSIAPGLPLVFMYVDLAKFSTRLAFLKVYSAGRKHFSVMAILFFMASSWKIAQKCNEKWTKS